MAPLRLPRDRVLAYGIDGDTPRYLATIDTSLPLVGEEEEYISRAMRHIAPYLQEAYAAA